MHFEPACYILPGIIAVLLGFFSAIQLLHERSGSAANAMFSVSGMFYLMIRAGFALAAYLVAHAFFWPEDELHPADISFSEFSLELMLVLFDLSPAHYIFGLIGGLGSEILLRSAVHAYTVPAKDGTKKEVMIGVQTLVKMLEDYTCLKAAIREANRKNKVIDKILPPGTPFLGFAESVRNRLQTYAAAIVKEKVVSFTAELDALIAEYDADPYKDNTQYNRVLAAKILNTFDKGALRDFAENIAPTNPPQSGVDQRSKTG